MIPPTACSTSGRASEDTSIIARSGPGSTVSRPQISRPDGPPGALLRRALHESRRAARRHRRRPSSCHAPAILVPRTSLSRRSPPTLSLSCRVSILFFFLALEPSRAVPVAGAPTNSGRRPPIPRTQGLLVFPCTYSKLSRAQPRVSPTGIDPAPAGHHWSTSKLYPRRRFAVSGELLLDSLHGEHLLPSLARFL